MPTQQNNQATQQGITGQQTYLNQYSNQKYGKILNLNNNVNYSISPNAVKLLPIISNEQNYVKLYTETNASVEIGNTVYIMYDENMTYDPIENSVYSTGRTCLDSFYEFSGCTNWIYLKQIQGYKVINVNETNNEITINRFYDSTLDNIKLYNHYLCKIYVNDINFYGGWIDGASFRNIELNNTTDTYIDVDIKQCIVLSGINSYYTHFKDKYDSQYVSVNSNLISNNNITTSINPYKYKAFNASVQNSTTSFFTYNNNSFGYSYINYMKLYNSKIENGYFTNCVISGSTILGGNFTNCKIYNSSIQSGLFTNCDIDSNSIWYYGTWVGSGATSFGPVIWYNGIWNDGVFSGKTWMSGIFNAGVFVDSLWVNGIFNGGGSIYNTTNQENFKNSYWSGGTFNFGYMKDSIWATGKFNGGTFLESQWFTGVFNSGLFQNSFWSGGTFNNGTIDKSYWFNGIFNNGIFNNSIWFDGIFNNGVFKTGYSSISQLSGITNRWYNGTFNNGVFNNSVWINGIFNNGTIASNSLWSGGTFNYGKFNDSVWLNGNWNNGIVNNSIFNSCNWKYGTFNSGTMGKEYYIVNEYTYTEPNINWSGGTFNSGIFGSDRLNSHINWYNGNFYGGYFYNTGLTSGFYNGVFYEGYFFGDYWGGYWISGLFSSIATNHTNQIIPISYKYNNIAQNTSNLINKIE